MILTEEEIKETLDDRFGTAHERFLYVAQAQIDKLKRLGMLKTEPEFNNALQADALDWDTRNLPEPPADRVGAVKEILRRHNLPEYEAWLDEDTKEICSLFTISDEALRTADYIEKLMDCWDDYILDMSKDVIGLQEALAQILSSIAGRKK